MIKMTPKARINFLVKSEIFKPLKFTQRSTMPKAIISPQEYLLIIMTSLLAFS